MKKRHAFTLTAAVVLSSLLAACNDDVTKEKEIDPTANIEAVLTKTANTLSAYSKTEEKLDGLLITHKTVVPNPTTKNVLTYEFAFEMGDNDEFKKLYVNYGDGSNVLKYKEGFFYEIDSDKKITDKVVIEKLESEKEELGQILLGNVRYGLSQASGYSYETPVLSKNVEGGIYAFTYDVTEKLVKKKTNYEGFTAIEKVELDIDSKVKSLYFEVKDSLGNVYEAESYTFSEYKW